MTEKLTSAGLCQTVADGNQTGSVPVAALWDSLGTVVYFEGRRVAESFREQPAGLCVCETHLPVVGV